MCRSCRWPRGRATPAAASAHTGRGARGAVPAPGADTAEIRKETVEEIASEAEERAGP